MGESALRLSARLPSNSNGLHENHTPYSETRESHEFDLVVSLLAEILQ